MSAYDNLLADAVGIYHFENNLNDSSVNARNGTGTAGVTFSSTIKQVGIYALYLTTIGTDYVTLPYAFLNGNSHSWTMAFWLKVPSITSGYHGGLIGCAGTGNDVSLNFYAPTSSTMTLQLRDKGGTTNFTQDITQGQWVNVVIDWDYSNNIYHYYVTNMFSGTKSSIPANVNGGTETDIGYGTLNTPYIQSIDELLFWARLLSDNERSTLYSLVTGPTPLFWPTGSK